MVVAAAEARIREWAEILGDAGFSHVSAVVHLFSLADALDEEMNQIARSEGLANQDDYHALSVLRRGHHRGQRLTVTDMASELGETTATTTNRLARLQRLGYVERTAHPTDRRSVHIDITASGAESAERMVVERTQRRLRWLSALTDEEQATFSALIHKLATTATG